MDPYPHIQPGFSFIFLRLSSLYLRSTLTDIPPDFYLYNLEKQCKLVCMYHTSMQATLYLTLWVLSVFECTSRSRSKNGAQAYTMRHNQQDLERQLLQGDNNRFYGTIMASILWQTQGVCFNWQFLSSAFEGSMFSFIRIHSWVPITIFRILFLPNQCSLFNRKYL